MEGVRKGDKHSALVVGATVALGFFFAGFPGAIVVLGVLWLMS